MNGGPNFLALADIRSGFLAYHFLHPVFLVKLLATVYLYVAMVYIGRAGCILYLSFNF